MDTVDDAIEALAAAWDAPPVEAMRWSLDHWDACAPRFATMLEAYLDGSDRSDRTAESIFFIVHLLGDRGDKRAFPLLCRMMLDEDRLISTLGYVASIEHLKGMLINCFDGDAVPLRAVIESPEAESLTRGEALLALAWLARDGQWPEREMRTYIRHLFDTMRPREKDYVWYNLIVATAALGYREFDADMRRTFEQDLIPEEWMEAEDYPDLIEGGDPHGKTALTGEGVAPFEGALAVLADWPWEDDDEVEDDNMANQVPAINPLRHLGRNDLCPCGSGKKYKKCCLVA